MTYSVVVITVVTEDVLALRVVVSVCVLIKVDVTVTVDGCTIMAVVVLSSVRTCVKDSVLEAVVFRMRISGGCASCKL